MELCLYFHQDRQDHRGATCLLDDQLRNVILDLVLDRAPLMDIAAGAIL